MVDTLDDNLGIRPYTPGRDFFADILTDYLEAGRAQTGIVGAAASELIDAADLVQFGVTWMTEHLQ